MILQRQLLSIAFRLCDLQAAEEGRKCRPIRNLNFAMGILGHFVPIAGGEQSTDELYPDARTSAPGTAAQDTAGHAQRLATGPADRFRAGASVKFPA